MISAIQIYRSESAILQKVITRYVEFRGSRVISDIGALTLTLTESQAAGIPFQPDIRIVPVLSDGSYMHLFGTYLLSGWEWQTIGRVRYVTLLGLCANSLLSRRIVAYAAGTSQSSKNKAADDMMREIVRENLAEAAGVERNISGYGISVESDLTLASTVELSFSWQKVFDTINKIAETAYAKNQEKLVWDFTPQGEGWNVIYRVRKDGFRDRRVGQSNELVIHEGSGIIDEVTSSYDRRGSSNFVYGGGKEIGTDRMIRTVFNNSDLVRSPIARAEAFYNGSNDEEDELISGSSSRLSELGPVVKYQAKLLEGPDFRYGRDIQIGDLLTLGGFGEHNVLVRSAQLSRKEEEYTVELTLEEV